MTKVLSVILGIMSIIGAGLIWQEYREACNVTSAHQDEAPRALATRITSLVSWKWPDNQNQETTELHVLRGVIGTAALAGCFPLFMLVVSGKSRYVARTSDDVLVLNIASVVIAPSLSAVMSWSLIGGLLYSTSDPDSVNLSQVATVTTFIVLWAFRSCVVRTIGMHKDAVRRIFDEYAAMKLSKEATAECFTIRFMAGIGAVSGIPLALVAFVIATLVWPSVTRFPLSLLLIRLTIALSLSSMLTFLMLMRTIEGRRALVGIKCMLCDSREVIYFRHYFVDWPICQKCWDKNAKLD